MADFFNISDNRALGKRPLGTTFNMIMHLIGGDIESQYNCAHFGIILIEI